MCYLYSIFSCKMFTPRQLLYSVVFLFLYVVYELAHPKSEKKNQLAKLDILTYVSLHYFFRVGICKNTICTYNHFHFQIAK